MRYPIALFFIFSFVGVVKVQDSVVEKNTEQAAEINTDDEIDAEAYRKMEI